MSTSFQDSVFKYVSFPGLVRFNQSWSLRLTPPREFNDPFEFYPSVNSFFSTSDIVPEFKRLAPAMFVRDLTAKMLPQFRGILTENEVDHLNSLLLLDGNEDSIRSELSPFTRKLPSFPVSNFLLIRKMILSDWPKLMAQADLAASAIIPTTNKEIRAALVDNLASRIGVICFSHSENQPLMWAHYADSHRGAMIVFDPKSASLTRKAKPRGRMGFLSDVNYCATRPTINYQTLTDIDLFQTYTLTKSEEWAYEKECRLVLELAEADSAIKNGASEIHLLSIEPAAVRSIVFGCNTSLQSRDELVRTMRKNHNTNHLSFYQSSIDQSKYQINYTRLSV